jgi:hypothetical protein
MSTSEQPESPAVEVSCETRVTPRAVSKEFIVALKEAGARPSLVAALEKSASEKKR